MKAETLEKRLQSVEHLRKGHQNVLMPHRLGQPIATRDCKICGKPAMLTSFGRWACRPCRFVFDTHHRFQ